MRTLERMIALAVLLAATACAVKQGPAPRITAEEVERAHYIVSELFDGTKICGDWVVYSSRSRVRDKACISREDLSPRQLNAIWGDYQYLRKRYQCQVQQDAGEVTECDIERPVRLADSETDRDRGLKPQLGRAASLTPERDGSQGMWR